MKRYLFSILLALFAIGGIGVGYIYSSIDHLPIYKLVTVQGDPQEGKVIQLSGSYLPRMFSEAIDVNAEGSKYYNEQSNLRTNILSSGSWFWNYYNIQQLVAENRQFMRGKNNRDGMYSDEDLLIYVEAIQSDSDRMNGEGLLKISSTNKSSELTKEYELTLSEDETFGFEVRDLQLIDNDLHVLLSMYLGERKTPRVYEYIVNFNDGQLKSIKKIIGDDRGVVGNANQDDYFYGISIITELAPFEPSDFVVLREYEEHYIDVKGMNSYTMELVNESYHAYNYRTGELSGFSFASNERREGLLIGNTFFNADVNKNEAALSSYNLVTGETKLNDPVITASNLGVTSIGNSIMEGNRLYVLLKRDNIPMVASVDIFTGEVLYIGEVVYDGPNSEAKDAMEKIQLLNIRIHR